MLKTSRRNVLLGGAAAIGSVAVAGRRTAFGQAKPIRIGVIQTLSGPAASFGKDTLLGAQVAADYYNSQGGVLGRQIELVVRDDKSTPNDALAVLRELSSDGVNMILGSSTSAPTLAVLPVLESLNAIWVMPGGTALAFTHEMFTRNYFHSTSNAYMYYYGAGVMLAQRHPTITKWNSIVADLAATQQLNILFRRGLRDGFAAAGKKVELLEPVTSKFGTPDYRNQIATLRDSGAEGLLLAVVGGDALTFLQQARGFGLQDNVKVFMDATNGLDLGKGMKQNLSPNSYTPLSWTVGGFDNEVSKRFDAEVKKRTGEPITTSLSAQGHNGITGFIEAIKATKSTESKPIVDALETMTFQESVYGPHTYRKEDHQVQIDVGIGKLGPATTPAGWEIAEYIRIPWQKSIEPASPGVKFDYGN